MPVQANELSPTIVINWVSPPIGQIGITRTASDRVSSVCFQVFTDGYSNQATVEHKLNINAADLAAGYPLVEIYNPQTNPIPASTGATHTTLTGPPALLGVTVLSSGANFIILAFATPAAAPGAQFQVLLTRNPLTPIPS